MCAVPLRVRTDVIGALNLFRGSDEPFTVTEMEIAQAMAEMAAIGLIQERALRERNLLAVQLQGALNSRVIIEQAKGMIAEYLNIPVDDAFKLLQNYARDHNRKSSTALHHRPQRPLHKTPNGSAPTSPPTAACASSSPNSKPYPSNSPNSPHHHRHGPASQDQPA